MEAGACSCELGDQVRVKHVRVMRTMMLRSCEECGKELSKGDLYVRVAAVVDDGWVNHVRCQACHAIAEDYCCGVVGYPGVVAEEVWAAFGLELGQGPEEIESDDKRIKPIGGMSGD